MSASNRSLLFLLGLVLGLLVGAGFFIFKMGDLLKKGNIFAASRDTLIIRQQVENISEEKKNKTDIKKNAGQSLAFLEKDTLPRTMNSAELMTKKHTGGISVRKTMASDSLLRDTSFLASENFVVRKDQMVRAGNFEVVNLPSSDTKGDSDSLLEKISGIRDARTHVVAFFKVEFWQSPINYKGYKMTKNKIVLFGINPDEILKFYHAEDAIFMKQNQNYFKLYFTDDFRQLEKVTDVSLTEKLK